MYYSLHIIRKLFVFLLFIIHYSSLFFVRYPLFIIRYTLFVIHNSLSIIHYPLFISLYSLYRYVLFAIFYSNILYLHCNSYTKFRNPGQLPLLWWYRWFHCPEINREKWGSSYHWLLEHCSVGDRIPLFVLYFRKYIYIIHNVHVLFFLHVIRG